MLKEMLVFSRGDGVFQDGRHLFPGEQDAPLQCEISDLLAVVGVELGHDVGAIILQRADFRQIRGVDKHETGGGTEQDGRDKQNRKRQASGQPVSTDL